MGARALTARHCPHCPPVLGLPAITLKCSDCPILSFTALPLRIPSQDTTPRFSGVGSGVVENRTSIPIESARVFADARVPGSVIAPFTRYRTGLVEWAGLNGAFCDR